MMWRHSEHPKRHKLMFIDTEACWTIVQIMSWSGVVREFRRSKVSRIHLLVAMDTAFICSYIWLLPFSCVFLWHPENTLSTHISIWIAASSFVFSWEAKHNKKCHVPSHVHHIQPWWHVWFLYIHCLRGVLVFNSHRLPWFIWDSLAQNDLKAKKNFRLTHTMSWIWLAIRSSSCLKCVSPNVEAECWMQRLSRKAGVNFGWFPLGSNMSKISCRTLSSCSSS